jgi:hypothetical protein
VDQEEWRLWEIRKLIRAGVIREFGTLSLNLRNPSSSDRNNAIRPFSEASQFHVDEAMRIFLVSLFQQLDNVNRMINRSLKVRIEIIQHSYCPTSLSVDSLNHIMLDLGLCRYSLDQVVNCNQNRQIKCSSSGSTFVDVYRRIPTIVPEIWSISKQRV